MLRKSAAKAGTKMLKVAGKIGTGPGNLEPAEFTIDKRSLYSLISPSLAESLGIRFPVSAHARNSRGEDTEIPLGLAYIRVLGREGAIGVGCADVSPPRLGSSALHALGMEYDAANETVRLTGRYPPPV